MKIQAKTRGKQMDKIKEFYDKFSDEKMELIVVMESGVTGAAVFGDDWLRPSVNFVASINTKTNELSHEKGRLEWMYQRGTNKTNYGYTFKAYSIYKIAVRKIIPVEIKKQMFPTANNTFLLEAVTQYDVENQLLEAIANKLSQPVTLKTNFGTFALNRKFGCFEGHVLWQHHECSISMDTDKDNEAAANQTLAILEKLMANQAEWDQRCRKLAVTAQLVELANDWAEDEQEITQASFVSRITPSEFVINDAGVITIYFKDDDIFYGHAIELCFKIDGTFISSQMVG